MVGCLPSSCPLVRAFEGAGPGPGPGPDRVLPSFCPLYRLVLGAFPLKYAFIRVLKAFLAWFGVVVWVCLVLVLCVACVAFVCVNS